MDAISTEIGEIRSLFNNRPLRRLWAAQLTTVTVVYALSLGGIVLVEEQTHSSVQTGLVILSSIVPAFLGSLVAGAVVDRFGRVRVLMSSHLARALVALTFFGGTQLLPPGLALTTIYTTNAAAALLTQFATPAEMALLPDLVGRTRLISANVMFQLSMLVGEGLGILCLGPLVIKQAGAPAMGVIGALLYLWALTLVATLLKEKTSTDRAAKEWQGWAALGRDLQAGWRTIAQDRLLSLVTVQATLAAILLLELLSLSPGLASRHLGLKVENASFLMLPGGIGFVLGAVLVTRWEGRLSRQGWIAIGLTSAGLNTVLLAGLTGQEGLIYLGLSLVPILGVGLALSLVIIPARTVLQERPPAEMRGRVIATQLALGNAAAVFPLLIGGAMADRLGIRTVMGLLGLLVAGAGAVGLYHAHR